MIATLKLYNSLSMLMNIGIFSNWTIVCTNDADFNIKINPPKVKYITTEKMPLSEPKQKTEWITEEQKCKQRNPTKRIPLTEPTWYGPWQIWGRRGQEDSYSSELSEPKGFSTIENLCNFENDHSEKYQRKIDIRDEKSTYDGFKKVEKAFTFGQ